MNKFKTKELKTFIYTDGKEEIPIEASTQKQAYILLLQQIKTDINKWKIKNLSNE